MNLAKNFTLEEMLRSRTAEKNGYKEQFTPSKEVIQNLTGLCLNILQPLREYLGIPVFVGSGYRCKRLNDAVRGVETSQHRTGEAADLQATGKMGNAELFEAIKAAKLPFDQLIWEFGDKDNPAWVHVSFSARNRRQILYLW